MSSSSSSYSSTTTTTSFFVSQASYYVMTHAWPVSQPEALTLSGRLCVMRFGRHNRRKHVPGTLTHVIHTFIPEQLLIALPQMTVRDWEIAIFQQHAALRDNVSVAANQQKWLKLLVSGSVGAYYGSTLFPVMQSFNDSYPRRIMLAINKDGVLLLRRPNMTTRFTMVGSGGVDVHARSSWGCPATRCIVTTCIHRASLLFWLAFLARLNLQPLHALPLPAVLMVVLVLLAVTTGCAGVVQGRGAAALGLQSRQLLLRVPQRNRHRAQ